MIITLGLKNIDKIGLRLIWGLQFAHSSLLLLLHLQLVLLPIHSLTQPLLSSSSQGHKAAMILCHLILSWALALPHVRPISFSSFIIVLHQVVFGRPLSFLPVGVHLMATLGILSSGILSTWPSHHGMQFLISRDIFILSVSFLKWKYILKVYFSLLYQVLQLHLQVLHTELQFPMSSVPLLVR